MTQSNPQETAQMPKNSAKIPVVTSCETQYEFKSIARYLLYKTMHDPKIGINIESIRFIPPQISPYLTISYKEKIEIAMLYHKLSKKIAVFGFEYIKDISTLIRVLPLHDPLWENIDLETINDAFLNAAEQGDSETLLSQLDAGSPIEIILALYLSAHHGHADVVKSLITHTTVNLNYSNSENITPLILAVQQGHHEVVKIFIKDPRFIFNSSTQKLLLLAAQYGHHEVINLLCIDGRFNPSALNELNETALSLSVQFGHCECVKSLLKDPRVYPNKENALLKAAQYNQCRVIAILLADDRVNPNEVNEKEETALFIAAKFNYHLVVKLLLADMRVNPNLMNIKGESPLYIASFYGHQAIVSSLLELDRVERNHTNHQGFAALHIAIINLETQVVHQLLHDRLVNVNLTTKDGDSALLLAARKGSSEIINVIISCNKITYNQHNLKTGEIPFYTAALYRSLPGILSIFHFTQTDTKLTFDSPSSKSTMQGALRQHEHHAFIRALLFDRAALTYYFNQLIINPELMWEALTENRVFFDTLCTRRYILWEIMHHQLQRKIPKKTAIELLKDILNTNSTRSQNHPLFAIFSMNGSEFFNTYSIIDEMRKIICDNEEATQNKKRQKIN